MISFIEENKRKFMIILVIVVLVVMLNTPGSTELVDKKTGKLTSTVTILAGLGATALGLFVLPVGGLGLPFFFGGLGTTLFGIKGLTAPTPTIPNWVWIVGFGFLFFMMVQRKK